MERPVISVTLKQDTCVMWPILKVVNAMIHRRMCVIGPLSIGTICSLGHHLFTYHVIKKVTKTLKKHKYYTGFWIMMSKKNVRLWILSKYYFLSYPLF